MPKPRRPLPDDQAIGRIAKQVPGRDAIDAIDRIAARLAHIGGDDDPDAAHLTDIAHDLRVIRWLARGGKFDTKQGRHWPAVDTPRPKGTY